MQFTRNDIETTRKVSYDIESADGWPVHRIGSYAPGFEHLADEVWTVKRASFFFGMALGQWVLREIVLNLELDGRFYHERITDQYHKGLPWWLLKMAASASQEPWH